MKTLAESIAEALNDNPKYEELDMRLEELSLDRSKVFGKNKVPYKQNDKVYDYLLETSGDAIAKPFDALDKAVMSAFGVDWKNVEVYRHVVLEDFDYAECIIYTSKGKPTEGEDHEYAVEDVYPAD